MTFNEKYNEGDFLITAHTEIKQIPQKKKETKEYTIGQLAEILGHNIKIIE
jgi:hypothetical protein